MVIKLKNLFMMQKWIIIKHESQHHHQQQSESKSKTKEDQAG